jgi:hypothetical protein
VPSGSWLYGDSTPEASAEVLAARDAARTYVREQFEDAPAESLSWIAQRLTPEDLPGGVTWQYPAGDRVLTGSYAVLSPQWTVRRACSVRAFARKQCTACTFSRRRGLRGTAQRLVPRCTILHPAPDHRHQDLEVLDPIRIHRQWVFGEDDHVGELAW